MLLFLCRGIYVVLLHWFSASALLFQPSLPCCGIFNLKHCGSQLATVVDASFDCMSADVMVLSSNSVIWLDLRMKSCFTCFWQVLNSSYEVLMTCSSCYPKRLVSSRVDCVAFCSFVLQDEEEVWFKELKLHVGLSQYLPVSSTLG